MRQHVQEWAQALWSISQASLEEITWRGAGGGVYKSPVLGCSLDLVEQKRQRRALGAKGGN